MEILFLKWNSFGNPDIIETFEHLGFHVTCCRLKRGTEISGEEQHAVKRQMESRRPDFVFSFNYIPDASMICQEYDVPYVSWVYDSPHIQVYSYTVLNPCNYIFLFDYFLYDKFAKEGISTIHYLPLAVNERRMQNLQNSDLMKRKYESDISFVGALYDEPKHRLYDKFQKINPYAKGYLDAITIAQKMVYGYNFLEEMLTPQIVDEMEKEYPTDPNASTAMKPEEIYAEYVLNRHVTAMERREILQMLGKVFPENSIRLYSNNKTQFKGVENPGPVDYYDEMPYVFMNSKINLNITLRSIKTGIPLRAFDIMGCGGFLLSNYQQELLEYFEPDVDFVYYSSYDELLTKAEYYMSHDRERREIARNGREKVLREHTMTIRAEEIVRKVLK